MPPLRLTAFEEYMLLDDQPAYPMSCFFKIKLRGEFNAPLFSSALQQTLTSHPLLTSSVTEQGGHFFWQPAARPEVVRLPFDEFRRFPASQGIDLHNEPSLKIAICHADTDPAAVILDGQTDIVFELHHSACDAAGIARFIEDLLCRYAHQAGFAAVQRESVNPELLFRRGMFGPPRNRILRNVPKQCWGLLRAWTFLMNRVIPLTFQKPPDAVKPPADYPAILHKELTITETKHVLSLAKQRGISVNDLLLGAAFLAINRWRKEHVREQKSGYLRIAVPTNLRTSADRQMPAANIVSMVFLDRKPERIQNTESFYQAIHREMQHIKRCNLGWAFIHGLVLYRRLFGSFRKMTRQNRCWSTATVTNLGQLFMELPLPVREGNLQIDRSLELIGIETAPPIRSGTALGISTMTYAQRMTINVIFDSQVVTGSDVQAMLDEMVQDITAPLLGRDLVYND